MAESTSPADLRTRELTVLTYNVRGLPWPAARGRPAALRAIGQALGELRAQGRAPDIILIQEGFGDVGELVRLSGYRYWAQGPQRRDGASVLKGGLARARWVLAGEGWGKFTGSGLHVLSDLPLAEVESMTYRHCAGFDCLANKGAMLVRVEVQGLAAPLDVVNTHMNSRSAANVPHRRSNRIHNLQTDELLAFIASKRGQGAPLIVGGDFNVKNAPDRYDYKADQRPFRVVSEYCDAVAVCDTPPAAADVKPWLASQDLQGFSSQAPVAVQPLQVRTLFAGDGTGEVLSDHAGVAVRYRLAWAQENSPRITLADAR